VSKEAEKLDLPVFSLDELIAGAEREKAMRYRVYPNLINRGKMTIEESKREIALMGAIVSNLKAQKPDLFASATHGKPDPDCFHCIVSRLAMERQNAGHSVGDLAGGLLDVCADMVLSQPADNQDDVEDTMIKTLRRLVSEGRKILTATTH
jgi:hypothetical protein